MTFSSLLDPLLLGPALVFVLVFALVASLPQRQSRVALRLARHGAGMPSAPPATRRASRWRTRLRRPALPDRLTGLLRTEKSTAEARALLNRAGSPMSLEAFTRTRQLCTLAVAPTFAALVVVAFGLTPLGIAAALLGLLAVPRLPAIALKRIAKKRAREMDLVISDVLDLLVVCVEGGQSLPAALMQVSQRMENVASEEFSRLLADINSGMSRRDAFTALADRCQSDALSVACTTIIHADKVGMSLAQTLRTLSDMMRTRRRQAAETRARQAPIKMMPVLVGFMLPAMLALLLGPVALEAMKAFR
jgi:tight adherence protein C